MTTLNFPHQDDNHWLTIEVGGVEHPQYPSPLEVKMLIEEAVRKATRVATIEAWSDAIELSDQLEESNTKFDEWLAFKGFRNGLRDRIRALLTPNHQD